MSTTAEPKLVTRPFLLLLSGHLLQALGFSSMLLLPLYLNHLGASRKEIGAIMASAAIGGLLFRPAVAWALDAWGRRPTLIVGTLFICSGMGMVAFITGVGVYPYVQRGVFGIGQGALFSGYFAFAADIVPRERRTEGLALFGVSGLLPLAINPAVEQAHVAPENLRWLFPVVGAVILLSIPLLFMMPEAERHEKPGQVRLTDVGRAIGARPLWPVWIATVVFGCLVASFMAFSTVTGAARGIERPALLWLSYSGSAVLVRLVGGRLPDRLGTSNLVMPTIGLYVGASLLVASGWSTLSFLAAGALAGVGHGYCFPVLASQVVTRSPAHLRGTALTTYTAIWELSRLVLTPMFGAIADQYDDATMFASLALGSLILMVPWVALEAGKASQLTSS
ncbi:MAG: MFS transporter [Myxococcales bacterium]|nr:MFS transporter [Myxococcales bacterium]